MGRTHSISEMGICSTRKPHLMDQPIPVEAVIPPDQRIQAIDQYGQPDQNGQAKDKVKSEQRTDGVPVDQECKDSPNDRQGKDQDGMKVLPGLARRRKINWIH